MKKTNRRAVITRIAAGATALTLAAVPGLALPVDPDPVFAAIVAHEAAISEVDRLLALYQPTATDSAIEAALKAECAAAKALIVTAPTTPAGLRALAAHLREDDAFLALNFIERTVTTDDGFTYRICSRDAEAVDWLIAKRAAELAS